MKIELKIEKIWNETKEAMIKMSNYGLSQLRNDIRIRICPEIE